MKNLFKAARTHGGRVFNPHISKIELTEHETQKLDQMNVTSNHAVRAYMVWRRSIIIIALPSLLVAMILAWVTSFHMLAYGFDEELGYNGLGRMSLFLPSLSLTILLSCSAVALATWRNLSRSTQIMKIGWVVALVLPLVPALIPTDLLFEEDFRTEDQTIDGFVIRTFDAAGYMMKLAPLIWTLPNGVIQGANRIRRLLPFSSLAGWVIVMTAPFLCSIMLGSLLLLVQLSGDTLILVGSLFLVLSPTLYLAFRKLYTYPSTTDAEETRLGRCQKAVMTFQIVGVIIVFIGISGIEIDGLSALDLIRVESITELVVIFLFESTGRILTNNVFMADTILGIVVQDFDAHTKRMEMFGSGIQDMEDMHNAVTRGVRDSDHGSKESDRIRANLVEDEMNDRDFADEIHLPVCAPSREDPCVWIMNSSRVNRILGFTTGFTTLVMKARLSHGKDTNDDNTLDIIGLADRDEEMPS